MNKIKLMGLSLTLALSTLSTQASAYYFTVLEFEYDEPRDVKISYIAGVVDASPELCIPSGTSLKVVTGKILDTIRIVDDKDKNINAARAIKAILSVKYPCKTL